jgi:hypothetical protein
MLHTSRVSDLFSVFPPSRPGNPLRMNAPVAAWSSSLPVHERVTTIQCAATIAQLRPSRIRLQRPVFATQRFLPRDAFGFAATRAGLATRASALLSGAQRLLCSVKTRMFSQEKVKYFTRCKNPRRLTL